MDSDELEKKIIKTKLNHSFKILSDLLTIKKKVLTDNKYTVANIQNRYHDQEFMIQLDAINNILQIMNDRLNKLEEKK